MVNYGKCDSNLLVMPLISVGGYVFRSTKDIGLLIAVIDDWVLLPIYSY
jgi:hypothetical protein